MGTKLVFSVCLLLVTSVLGAQDTTAVALDTLPTGIQVDSLATDSTKADALSVRISRDALDAAVSYNADTMRLDARKQKIFLRGNAFVSYTNITLRAAYIELDWSKSEVLARGMRNDTTGLMIGVPEFTEGDNVFNAQRMRYNFETRKGIVYDVVTQQDDIIVHGAKSKFISAPPNDTTAHDLIYSQDAIFTTCTADHPHFGIRSQKQKVIPNKLVVIGPSNLEIMGVPTPVWLPFGFFPVSGGRSTGLIFPRDFEQSPTFGFGLREVGWFFPLGDHFNLTVKGDYYLQGTYALGTQLQYRKRYGYSGNLNIRYDSRKQEQVVTEINAETGEVVLGPDGQPKQLLTYPRTNGISINWSHNQDAAAHPMNRLGGSINFSTNNIQQTVFNDARTVNQNVINSNFTFSRNWSDKPFSMSMAFQHSQNTRTRQMTVNFPTFQFQTQALYPFRIKERTGPKRWYEDITMRYTNEARSTFSAPDSTFFVRSTLDNARYGMQHNVTTGTSFKILKYFNLNPSVNYREVWNMSSLTLNKDIITGVQVDTIVQPDGTFTLQTVDYGDYKVDTLQAFSPWRSFSASVGMNTQIFGTWRFQKGWLRGIRHVIKPTVSLGLQPDYMNNPRYFEINDVDPRVSPLFARLKDGIYGGPPSSEMQLAMNYSITNIFEAKLFNKRDSTEKNIKLFDNIYISGSHNFMADTLKWSPIATSGTLRLFKGATTFGFNATFDPQVRVQNSSGAFVRTKELVWDQRKLPFAFQDATFRFNTSLTVSKIRAIFQGEEEEVVEEVDFNGDNLRPSDETDFLSLFENFSIAHNIAMGITPVSADKDTFRVNTHSIELRGSLGLTPNWNVDIGSIGYDFTRKQTTYPYLGLRRDLHCWEMGFNWAPTRNTYAFYLRVKPGTLDFIKVPYQRNNADGPGAF
ncbi:MAG: putative LPS assembly protein LptD [Saprospiraceae bacterium]